MDFGQKSQIWASRGQTMSRGWKASLSTMHVAPTVPMVGTCCPTCGCAVLGSHQIIHGWFSSGPRPGGPFGPGWFWGGFSGRLGATPLCGSGWVATLKIREINFRVSLILNEIKNANRWDTQELISLKIWLTGKLAIIIITIIIVFSYLCGSRFGTEGGIEVGTVVAFLFFELVGKIVL